MEGYTQEEIYKSPYSIEIWDKAQTHCCFIHLCNSRVFLMRQHLIPQLRRKLELHRNRPLSHVRKLFENHAQRMPELLRRQLSDLGRVESVILLLFVA